MRRALSKRSPLARRMDAFRCVVPMLRAVRRRSFRPPTTLSRRTAAGKFVRRFQLPRNTDPTRPVEAAVRDGVLSVAVPKLPDSQAPPQGQSVPVRIAWHSGGGEMVEVGRRRSSSEGQDASGGGRVPSGAAPSGFSAAPPMPVAAAAAREDKKDLTADSSDSDSSGGVISGVGHPEPLQEHTGAVEERVAAGGHVEEPDSELQPVVPPEFAMAASAATGSAAGA